MQLIQRMFFLTVMTMAALLVAACSGSQSAEPEETTVQVKLTEFAIEPAEITVKPGTVTFAVENAGALEHNIFIEELDQGIDFIFPAQTSEFAVQLASGAYKLVCTVEGHEAAGMVGELIVEE